MKAFAIFTIGLVLGLMLGVGALTIKNISESFWAITQDYESSSQAREKIESKGIKLPSDAHDFEYYYYAGMDYTCWIAFSAKNEDIEKIIPTIVKNREFENKMTRVPDPPEYWDKDSTNGNWWPTSSKGMKIFAGEFFWIAHDTINQRLYYYSYSI
ncbi:hypothetical protein SH580_11995 [Coraliomargarita algicola]|uniref:Uncharacterized protein n=1 Tax=Coraliomargarita algicola TaxID=3092156 RepID=A0ABZ0RDC1_9BACT|nr:hypothetical protein [Coraliomargarita sp. J2-16]WPJ94154.1 hypothetical protein SH580_11995 [Coraliomargarita sp. J2-16]